jgi:hypothetical protein
MNENKPVGDQAKWWSILPDTVRAAFGGLVVGLAIPILLLLGIAAFDALPDNGKGANVVAIVGSITTVIGTMVGGYVGARVGASSAEKSTEGAERGRAAEGIRLQEALGMLTDDKAAEAMDRADERLRKSGLQHPRR